MAGAEVEGEPVGIGRLGRIVGKGGKVTGVECARTKVENGKLIETEERFTLDADWVFRATGQEKLTEFLSTIAGLDVDRSGRVLVDDNGKTSHEKIWSGGDCVSGGKEVVNAVAEGKKAARHMHATLVEAVNG